MDLGEELGSVDYRGYVGGYLEQDLNLRLLLSLSVFCLFAVQ